VTVEPVPGGLAAPGAWHPHRSGPGLGVAGGEVPTPGGSVPRVVVATLLRGSGATGVETHIREVAAFSSAHGEVTTIVTPFSWVMPIAAPVFGARLAIDRVSPATGVAWYRYWHRQVLRAALSRHLARTPHAVVYAHCPPSAYAALRARRSPDQRVVMAVHFDQSQADEWVDKGRIRPHTKVYAGIRRLEAEVIPALDGIVYLSRSAQAALAGWLPAVEDMPSIVIPNFVEDAGLPDSDGATPSAPAQADLVSVGGLEPAKNHAFLLRVLAEANRLGRRYRLDIVGDGPCRGDLGALAAALGVEEQVRLLGYRSDVRSLLPRYRLYVHASTREVMALAPIEALAAGLPVVAAPVGGLTDMVDADVEGLFWSVTDPAAAARLLVDLLEDRDRLARMSLAARARFARSLDAAVVAPRLFDFLRSVPTRAGAGAGHLGAGSPP